MKVASSLCFAACLLAFPEHARAFCEPKIFNLSGTVTVTGESNQNDAVITLERKWQNPWEIVATATSNASTGSYTLATTADHCTGLLSATDWRLCVQKTDFIGGKLLKQKACVDRNWNITSIVAFERSNVLNLTWQNGRWAYLDPDDARYHPPDPNPFILPQSGYGAIQAASALGSRIVNINYPNGNFAKGLSFQREEDAWSGGQRFQTDGPSLDGQVFRIHYPDHAGFSISVDEPAFAFLAGKTVTLSLDVKVLEGPATQIRLNAGSTQSPAVAIGTAWTRVSHTFPSNFELDFGIKTVTDDAGGYYAIDNVVLELGATATPPQISMSYYDGLNREVQDVVLHGNDDVVTAFEFDAMGRSRKISKPFQAEIPVEESKFRYSYQTDAMQVANQYYSPTGPGPDAGGYAFTEPEYTTDESDRILKGGSPGRAFSLDPVNGHPVSSSFNGVKNRTFSRLQEMPYGTNEPDAAYAREISTDEDGKKAVLIRDKMGNVVTTAAFLGEEIHATTTQFDVMNNKKSVTSPRGIQKKFKYNTLGLLEERNDPDEGTSKILYDQIGNPRFTQSEAQAAQGYFIGKKYDRLNRLSKIGRINGNANFTQPNAYLADYPSEFAETFVEYFHDALPSGNSPAAALASSIMAEFGIHPEDFRNLKGRVACVVTNNQFQNAFDENTIDGLVLKLFSYDEDGTVEASYLSVRGIPTQRALYRYTETKKLNRIEISTIAGPGQTYAAEYDESGRLRKVFDVSDANATVAEYEYWPHGAVKKITYGGNKLESDFSFNTRDWWLGVVHKNLTSGEELFKEQLYCDALSGVGGFTQKNYNGNISERIYAYAPSMGAGHRYRISQHEYDDKNRMTRYDWGAADAQQNLNLTATEFDEKYSFSVDDELNGLLRGTHAAELPSVINQLITVDFQGVKDDQLLYRLWFGDFENVTTTLTPIDQAGNMLASPRQVPLAQITDENDRFQFRRTFRLGIDKVVHPLVAGLKVKFSVVLGTPFGSRTVHTHETNVPFNAGALYEQRALVEARIDDDAGYAIEPDLKIPDPSVTASPTGESDYNHFSNYSYYPGTHKLEKISGTLKDGSQPYVSRDIPGNYVYDADGRLIEIKSHKIKIEYNWMDRPTKVSLGEGRGRKRTYNLYDENGDRIAKLQYSGSKDLPITVGIPTNGRDFTDLPAAFQKAKDDQQGKTNAANEIFAFSPTNEFEPAGPVDMFTEGQGNVIEIIGVEDPSAILPAKGMKDQTNDPDLTSSKFYAVDASGIVRNEIRGGTVADPKKDVLSVFGIDEMGRKINGLTEVYLKNHQRSTMVVASMASGAPIRAFDYHPHGMESQFYVNQSETVTPSFTGKELDDFGIYEDGGTEITDNMLHFGARYFDPEIAMWSGPDASEQFPSPYAYSTNPLSGYDPDGNSVVSKAVALGVKAAAKRKMKDIIKKNIIVQIRKLADKKVQKELLQEAADIVDSFDDPWWMQAISLIPVAGDLVDATSLFVHIKKAFKKADKLKERVDALTKGKKAAAKAEGEIHHLASPKNFKSAARGGPWSPRFEAMFKKAGMTLEDIENKVAIPGHRGPHPQAYHEAVFRRLSNVTEGLSGKAYGEAFKKELGAIRREASSPGTALNKLLTDP